MLALYFYTGFAISGYIAAILCNLSLNPFQWSHKDVFNYAIEVFEQGTIAFLIYLFAVS